MNFSSATLHTALAAIAQHIPRPDTEPPQLNDTTLTPAQTDAVRAARIAIARYGGTLIADPPGTGKSFIGLQLALEARRAGHTVLITAPASLLPTWKRLCSHSGITAHFLSHTRLSRDDATVAATPAPDFILVDEAHAFRSPHTRRYHTLARLARHARVLLLTATPINNSLTDLGHQLCIFLPDNVFSDIGVPALRAALRSAATTPADPLPTTLAQALARVVIRRSRNEIAMEPLREATSLATGSERLAFPRMPTPILIRYSLDAHHPDFVRDTLDTLQSLRLAAFTADTPRHRPPAELLRLTLAKRLESGLAAFTASIRSILAFHHAFLDALHNGTLLRPRDLDATSDRAAQLVFGCLVGQPLPPTTDSSAILRDVTADAEALQRLLRTSLRLARHDPKRQTLIQQLQGPLRHRHILLFTEFRETAADLFATLRHLPGVARLDGSGAWIASGRCGRAELLRRFAAAANHAPPPADHQRIRILIATDILAEGVNLQDADTVIAYDLPWNPVRLIQRIGRICRLGSPHPSVEARIFLPDQWLDGFMALVDRVDSKLRAIRHGLGAASSHLAAADRFTTFVRSLEAGLSPDSAFAGLRRPARDPAHPLARLRNHPHLSQFHLPPGQTPVASLRLPHARAGDVLLAVASPTGPRLLRCRNGTATPVTRAAARILLAALRKTDESRASQPSAPPPLTSHELDSLLQASAAVEATFAAHAQHSPIATRAIRRVIRLAAADPARSADLAPLADRLVARLTHGMRAGQEIAVRQWCRTRLQPGPPDATARLLHHLDSTLAAPLPTPRATVIAAFFIHPTTKREAAATRPPASSPPTAAPPAEHRAAGPASARLAQMPTLTDAPAPPLPRPPS